MKKTISFFIFCAINLLALSNSYGQTKNLSTPQLKDFNVENYFPKLGPAHIDPNNPTAKIELPIVTTNLFSNQSQQAQLATRASSYNIYILPIDQMPCVVPNNSISYKMNMPERSNATSENMPNAIGKQNWLPNEPAK